MFAQSTQSKYWVFSDESDLRMLIAESNDKHIKAFRGDITDEQIYLHFLSADEERSLCRHYETILREFCSRFQPPMPKYVMGTAMAYLKRVYLHNSVMNYHPRDVMLTCVYLACKVEEFNVSIGQYVSNLKGDREKFTDIVIGLELQLMRMLKYHLIVHNPFRALEGFLIDIKTRYKNIQNIVKLRQAAESFLERSLTSNVSLLFSPSQIALAALLTSSSSEGSSLDGYVADVLLCGHKAEELQELVHKVKQIKYLVKNHHPVPRDHVKMIEKKLEHCRNKENNPDTEEYKRKLNAVLEDDNVAKQRKKARLEKEMQSVEKSLVS